MSTEASDEELAVLARNGDRQAARLLTERYATPLYNFCRRMLRSDQDADEATQDTLLRALGALDRFDEKRKYASWVFRIARNTCIDRIRKRRPTFPADEQRMADTGDPRGSGLGVSPETRSQQKHDTALVHKALPGLRESYREIITLYHFNGLSYADISETLEIPMGTVMNRLWRARKALSKELIKLGYTP